MKVRAELLLEIREYIRKKGLKQYDAAALLDINRPEVSALMQSHIFKFNMDTLVDMLASPDFSPQHRIRPLLNGVCAHPGPTNPPTIPGGCAPQ